MARNGFNPMRRVQMDPENPCVAAVITHLPNQEGYHKNRLEIVKLSLTSMKKHLNPNVELWVWDNGSCADLTEWIQRAIKPTRLFLGPNIGKSNARNNLLYMAPQRAVVSVSDDDMLYRPGWWEACEKVLSVFPNVGVVSGYPVRTCGRWGVTSTKLWAINDKEATVEVGRFLPDAWDSEYAVSIGRGLTDQERDTVYDQDTRITYKGVQAYAMGHHAQWMGFRSRILPLARRSDLYAADERRCFDEPIDDAGLLRLSTVERVVQHAGNAPDNVIRAFAEKYGLHYGA